jgi:hypothetical protein
VITILNYIETFKNQEGLNALLTGMSDLTDILVTSPLADNLIEGRALLIRICFQAPNTLSVIIGQDLTAPEKYEYPNGTIGGS